jgi:hypothetical protein
MTNWIEDIKRMATDNGCEVTKQWLEQAEQEAPYSVLPALLYLKRNGVKGNEDVLSRLAIAFPDRRALALMLGEDAGLMSGFYPPEALPTTPDTVTTIDRFLDNYGKSSPGEIEALDRAIFNPQPDYADVLAAQEMKESGTQPTDSDAQDELINKFIAEQMQLGEQAAQVPITAPVGEQEKAEIADETIDKPTQTDDSMLSESLAKMYIARHKYSQALEIIERLSLKYPEKSIYFADQIRFLTKLVLNETLNDKK